MQAPPRLAISAPSRRKVLFLDESGDHNLTQIDPSYPVFVLGGVIVNESYAVGQMETLFREFKRTWFGDESVILHTADIVRRKGAFEILRDHEKRQRFYTTLNAMIREIDFSVVACVIKKIDHRNKYGASAIDPYHLSLNVLV